MLAEMKGKLRIGGASAFLLLTHQRRVNGHQRQLSNIPWLNKGPAVKQSMPSTAVPAGNTSAKPQQGQSNASQQNSLPRNLPSQPGGNVASLLQQAIARPAGAVGRGMVLSPKATQHKTHAQTLLDSLGNPPRQGGQTMLHRAKQVPGVMQSPTPIAAPGAGGVTSLTDLARIQMQKNQAAKDRRQGGVSPWSGGTHQNNDNRWGGNSAGEARPVHERRATGFTQRTAGSARAGQWGSTDPGSPVVAGQQHSSRSTLPNRLGMGMGGKSGAPFEKRSSGAFGARKRAASVARHARPQLARKIAIEDGMSLKELALQLQVPVSRLQNKIRQLGEEARLEQPVDPEVAELVVADMGHAPVRRDTRYADRLRTEAPTSDEMSKAGYPLRAPVVTVMGHVDHGKTTLLDALRGSDVASREAGGITQGVAAFSVAMRAPHVAVGLRQIEGEEGEGKSKKKDKSKKNEKASTNDSLSAEKKPTEPSLADVMTFLDTPGHALFSAMRKRGSSATDVVVLVVDGKDGIMPQTKECVDIILSLGLPCVVAVTKCDLVDPKDACTRVGKQLLELGLATTEFAGDTQAVGVSAKTGLGLADLKDAIALQAELLELRADVKAGGEAIVLDARVVVGQGQVVDCIMRWGTLKVGDVVVAGSEMGRVKALLTDATAAASLNKRLLEGVAASAPSKASKKGGKEKDESEGKSQVFELQQVKEVLPGTPVRVLGLKGNPEAGVDLLVVDSEERAEAVLIGRARRARLQEARALAAADSVRRAAEKKAGAELKKKQAVYELALTREKRRGYLRRNNIAIPPDMALQAWETAILSDPSLAGLRSSTMNKASANERQRQQGGQQSDVTMSYHSASSIAEASEQGKAAADKARSADAPIPLAFVVRTDSSGSLAAVKDAIARIGAQIPAVLPRIVSSGVGEVTEKDVDYASEMSAHVLAFAAKVPAAVSKAAERKKITLKSSRVIYHLLDEVLDIVAGVLPMERKEETVAAAEVRAFFDLNSTKVGKPSIVAGCIITEGTFDKKASVYRVVRDGKTVHEGQLSSLYIVKDKVESVAKGKECGMTLSGCSEYVVGDKIVAVKQTMVKQKVTVRLD